MTRFVLLGRQSLLIRPRQRRTACVHDDHRGWSDLGLKLGFGRGVPIRTETSDGRYQTHFFDQKRSPPHRISRFAIFFSRRTVVFASSLYPSFCSRLLHRLAVHTYVFFLLLLALNLPPSPSKPPEAAQPCVRCKVLG